MAAYGIIWLAIKSREERRQTATHNKEQRQCKPKTLSNPGFTNQQLARATLAIGKNGT
jgi:hypothetical protein